MTHTHNNQRRSLERAAPIPLNQSRSPKAALIHQQHTFKQIMSYLKGDYLNLDDQ